MDKLTPEQNIIVEQLSHKFAKIIINRADRAKYEKDTINYIKQKLNLGKLVEDIGESKVRDFYSNSNAHVWRNVCLQVKDGAGKNLGGEQAELDFFVHYSDGSSRSEIVSTKFDGDKVRPGDDLRNFNKFYNLNLTVTQEELVEEFKSKLGRTRAYNKAINVVVKYKDVKTGKNEEISLSECVLPLIAVRR